MPRTEAWAGQWPHPDQRRAALVGVLSLIAATASGGTALAQEFRSIAEPAAILYDAPSAKAKRLWLLGRGYPVQVTVAIEGWSKVRDATGELAWVENRALSPNRTVLVRAATASVRETPDDSSPVVLRVARDVVLDLVEPPSGAANDWIRVRHRDGVAGFIHANQVYGL
jgi:SH3-like domain-containing protein